MRRRGALLLLLVLGLLASSVSAADLHAILIPATDSTHEETTTPVYSAVTPVPTWADVLGQRVYNQSSVSHFQSRRTSWPSKPHLQRGDRRTGNVTHYYRVTLHVNEPFENEFLDRHSEAFGNISSEISEAVLQLYTDLPGRRTCRVLQIKRLSDGFFFHVKMDLGTINYYNDTEVLRDRLRRQVVDMRRLGSLPLLPEGFTFNVKGVGPSDPIDTCATGEMHCRNGDCFFSGSRCDGVNDCSDGSDELGCPSMVTESSRTTGGGLLLRLSLPPPPPSGTERGPPPHQLVEQLRTQLQSNIPGLKLDCVQPTDDLCPAEQDSRFKAPNGEPLHWPATKICDSAFPLEACLNSNMEPIRRSCLQDLTFGAQWADPEGTCDAGVSSEATQGLLNVTSLTTMSAESAARVTHQLAEAMGRAVTPRAGDVLLLAAALARVSAVAQGLSASCLPDLTNLLDGVLRASDAPPQQHNVDKDAEATSSILISLDAILSRMRLDDAADGIASSFTPRAALLVADVARSGVEGVMATSAGSNAVFSDVQPLRRNQSGKSEGVELVARITGDVTGSRAAFVLIGNSRTFPQRQNQVRLNSRVVGVTVTGNTGAGIELELRPLTSVLESGSTRHCAYWDLAASAWSTAGCTLVRHDERTGRDVCRCSHLTHFGEIIGVRGESRVLDAISLAGCVLSLLGLLGIALTAAVFRQWRSRLGNKILLHLSGAIGLTMIAFLSIALGGASGGTGDPGCIILGALLHYSVLASFCWMLVSAALQLLRFVVVLSSRPPHFLLKGVLVGWGAPLIPVLALVISGPVTSYSALDQGDGSQPFCYPTGLALILAVIVPVAMAVIANLTVFCIIVYRVTCGRNKRLHGNVSAMSERRMAIRQLRMSILLFFLLGLSWVFGLLALIAPNIDEWRLLLSYLFCATATLQGLALFLFFVVWERKARALWIATLPETVRIRTTTSDTTSGLSPSTGTTSGTARSRDEAAPLRQRNTELDIRTSGRATVNGYQTTQPQTRL